MLLDCITDCLRPKRRDRTDERRLVRLGDPQSRRQHPSNAVKSSKYNACTFVPMNLWEQFHRPINLYFLVMAALQFIPSVAPVSPYTVIFPISVAFLINTVKEGIDDVRRRRQDNENNCRRHVIVDPKTRTWKEVKSEAIGVGDLLLLRPFETVPSDVVVLMSSGEGGETYVSTESLDGETGTKERLAALRDVYDPSLMSPAASNASPSVTFGATAAGASAEANPRASQAMMRPPPGAHELRDAIDFLFAARIVLDSEGPNPFLHDYNATLTVTTAAAPAAPTDGPARRADGSGGAGNSRRRHRSAGLPRSSSSANSFGSGDEREALLSSGAAPPSRADSRGPGTSSADANGDGSPTRRSFGVTVDNVIFASSTTRNTRFVLAVVVFTGMETKVAMTRGMAPTKWANIDRKFNFMTMAIFLLQLLLLILYSSLSIFSLRSHRSWYLGGRHVKIPVYEYVPILPLRYFTMLSPMVPLSFKVMVEISKAYVSSVIRWDDDMRDTTGGGGNSSGGGEHASVNSSALAEDLGQVEYILSDKTGTLTANTMTLAALATADGTVYARDDEWAAVLHSRRATDLAEPLEAPGPIASASTSVWPLLAGMAFCNTIERSLLAGAVRPPQSKRDARKRQKRRAAAPAPEKMWASCSPDEVALVEGMEVCGVTLAERTRTMSRAVFWDCEECVDIVKVLPFSSVRGRMSVLIRRHATAQATARESTASAPPSGHVEDGEEEEYLLLMKGSDEKVLPLCAASSYRSPNVAREAQPAALLERFSTLGLRTLVYAYRRLSAPEAKDWLASMEGAEAAVTKEARAAKVAEAFAAVERDVVYCGCTAVEDQLQEQVGFTISQMRRASIRVWMLTGDKAETARQTAIASQLLTCQDRLFTLAPPDHQDTGATEAARQHQQLSFIRATVQRLLTEEVTLRDAMTRESSESFLQRLYRCAGMRDYVNEFIAPPSYELLKPLHHPIRSYNPDPELYPPEAVHLMTTTRGESASLASETAGSNCGYSLLLSGATIERVFASADTQLHEDFDRVLLGASTVICSRTAPDQKAKLVEVVKAAGKVTLAIGDGGNDVAMIQSAHVGVGIKGKEGNQAALSADFAIGQFRFLARLLLVHGHTAYQRTAVIVQQSFWKSVLIAWVQLLFNLFTDFSGISFWDSFCLVLYNAIPTVPVTFLCVMDVPLSPWMLVRNPQLYRMSQRGRYLNSTTFYGYVVRAMLQGTIVFFLALGINEGSGALLSRSGRTMDRSGDFYAAYFAVVTVHTFTVLTESHSINFAHWQCFLYSIWSCFLCFWLFSASPASSNPTFHVLLTNPVFYLSYATITTVVCLPQALFAAVKVMWFPDALQLQRTAALCARSFESAAERPLSALLAVLFEDDNPSSFWRSWSPLHAFLAWPPPVASAVANPTTEVSGNASPPPVHAS